jgi:hypothetical protein
MYQVIKICGYDGILQNGRGLKSVTRKFIPNIQLDIAAAN